MLEGGQRGQREAASLPFLKAGGACWLVRVTAVIMRGGVTPPTKGVRLKRASQTLLCVSVRE